MQGLRRNVEEDRPAGRRGAVRLAALVALLALGAAALPASGSATPLTLLGQLYAFGLNGSGELANETNLDGEPNPTPALVPLPPEAGATIQAAAGAGFSLAVTASGQLYSFGNNSYGELGNETNAENPFAANPTPTPVTLPGATGPATQAAGGGDHSLALTATGQLYAFGLNNRGQLGNPTNTKTELANPTPTLVMLPGENGPVTQVAAGGFHSLALTSSGQLYAFGSDSYGQLGSESTSVVNSTPTLVTLPGANGVVAQVAAGVEFSLVVTSSGQLYAFGENRLGQLGSAANQHQNPTPTLVDLPGEDGPVVQVAAGEYHSLALTSSGQLYAFGSNRFGQLGNATSSETSPPILVTPLPGAHGRIIRIATGLDYSLALTSTGQLYAFGSDYFGELGIPPGEGPQRSTPHPTPTPVAFPDGANVETMATGPWSGHTLAVLADLAVANSSLPIGEEGVSYSAQAEGTGGTEPYAWSASGLPQGLSIDPESGAISGTTSAVGTYNPAITLTDSYGIEASKQLTLRIKGEQTLTVAASGQGSVGAASGAITGCSESGGSCEGAYPEAATVVLTATPASHQAVAWEGCTTVPSADVCEVGIGESAAEVKANFTPITHALAISKAGSGQGSVTCNGGSCAASYPEGTALTVAATPAPGSTFAGWGGAVCAGTGACQIVLEADATVTATFKANELPPPPPPAEEKCVVPELAGKTLGRARSALDAAHCTLGKVTKPRHRRGRKRGHLVVHSFAPAFGTVMPVDRKVDVTLVHKFVKGGSEMPHRSGSRLIQRIAFFLGFPAI